MAVVSAYSKIWGLRRRKLSHTRESDNQLKCCLCTPSQRAPECCVASVQPVDGGSEETGALQKEGGSEMFQSSMNYS